MARSTARVEVDGIGVTHADRVLEPTGVTKLELAKYFEAIAPRMLPHVRGRPLSLLRWSEEPTANGGVFLRHARAWGPTALRRVTIEEKTKMVEYLVADDVHGLVALAQMSILEVHTWNSTVDHLEHPDRVVFDLDPGAGVSWRMLVESARELRACLRRSGLESWVKTTGSKGLHVVAPLLPRASYDACFAFTRAIAEELAARRPDRFVAKRGEWNRRGKVFVDYLRNNRTATSVAAYSPRARPGAAVSMPITWEELDSSTPPRFTLEDALRRRSDPWRTYASTRQRL
jgi:bifunctional non-homologous end joining protein LigD